MSVSEMELPYLKANQKPFELNNNPKYGKDMIKMDNLNSSFESQNLNSFKSQSKNRKDTIKAVIAAGRPSNFSRMSLHNTLSISESADIISYNKNETEIFDTSPNRSPFDIKTEERNTSIPNLSSLNAHKRRSLKIVDKINKNIAKLHKHTNVNWSLKDLPIDFFKKLNQSGSNSPKQENPESVYQVGCNKLKNYKEQQDIRSKGQAIYYKSRRLTGFSPTENDEVKRSNEDQKLQYYLNIAKSTKRYQIGNKTIDVKENRRKGLSISGCTDIFNRDLEIKDKQGRSLNINNVIDGNPLFGQTKSLSYAHFNKINAISDYCNKSNMYRSNYNNNFQINYKNNPEIFRKSKGMCSEFASYGAKHKFISSPFGRR